MSALLSLCYIHKDGLRFILGHRDSFETHPSLVGGVNNPTLLFGGEVEGLFSLFPLMGSPDTGNVISSEINGP